MVNAARDACRGMEDRACQGVISIKLNRPRWSYSHQIQFLYLSTLVPMVTIEFEARNITVNERDGSVTVNLVRTGSASGSVTIYISVTRDKLTAIHKRMYILFYLLYLICPSVTNSINVSII